MQTKPHPRRLGKAVHAASLSAFLGSVLSAALLCVGMCGVLIIDEPQVLSAADILVLPVVAFIAGVFGLIASLPAALVLGAPVLWFWSASMQAYPKPNSVLLALVGGVAGWAMYQRFFSGDLDAISRMAQFACPLFGTIVGGLHPLLFAWIGEGGQPAAPA